MALAGCFIHEPVSAAKWEWGQRRFHVFMSEVSDRHLPKKQVTCAAVITHTSNLPGGRQGPGSALLGARSGGVGAEACGEAGRQP